MWSYPVHQLLVLKADQSLSDEEQVGGSILHPDSTAQALINTGMKKFATNNQNSFVNVTLIRKCTSSFFLIITVILINKYKNDTKKTKMVDLFAFDQKKCCLWVLLSFLLGPVHGKRFQLGLKLKKKTY